MSKASSGACPNCPESVSSRGPGKNYVVQGSLIDKVPYELVEHAVDTVGAGDAFCAGFLSGMLQGADAVEAVRLGNITGAMVVQAFGDWEALPTAEQLQAVLNQAVHIER